MFLSVSKSPPVKRPNIHGWLGVGATFTKSARPRRFKSSPKGAEIRQCHVGPKVESQTGRVVGRWRLDSDVWDGWETHYGSMEKWYIHLHEWLIFMVNVGEYTIHGSYGKCFFLRIGGLPSRKRSHIPPGEVWKIIFTYALLGGYVSSLEVTFSVAVGSYSKNR